jgi:hypothetical protein
MEIYFDFELDENVDQPKDPENIVYKTLREFVKTRFRLLEPELDASRPPMEPALVVLSMKDAGLETAFFNLTDDQIEKLKGCFTEDDFTYISRVIWNKIKDDYNTGLPDTQ